VGMKKNSENNSTLIKSRYYTGLLIKEIDIDKFMKTNQKEGKKTVIIFGANWCPDARLLEGVMRLPTVKSFLERNANILNIDVGNYEINTALFKMFDKNIQDGIPRVFIMDRMGQNINLHANATMRKAREFSTQDIFDYFQEFVTET